MNEESEASICINKLCRSCKCYFRRTAHYCTLSKIYLVNIASPRFIDDVVAEDVGMIARMKSGGNHPPQLGKLVNCNKRINSAATIA
jgi:hypothetical protein